MSCEFIVSISHNNKINKLTRLLLVMTTVLYTLGQNRSLDIRERDLNGIIFVIVIIIFVFFSQSCYDKIGQFGYFEGDFEDLFFFADLCIYKL
jgi:hypothetical protein